MDERQFKEIIGRIDRLTRVMAMYGSQGLTTRERIVLLHKSGFQPKEIADILGISANSVNVRLSEMRRRQEL
jgi:DNA-binding CsgD family transcriptional regulator